MIPTTLDLPKPLLAHAAPKRKRVAHRTVITPELLDEVKRLAGLGLTTQQIHNFFGMCADTWAKRIKAHPELLQAIQTGKALTTRKVTGKLMEAIEKGNLGAIIFYLKTQARWSETSTSSVEITQHEGRSNQPLFTNVLTGAANDPVEASKIYQKIMMG